ncbi:MAG: ribonuclease III [bacterium]
MNEHGIQQLEAEIGIVFQNKDILKEALTHRSYLNENVVWKYRHNERLEFLGDAVLEIIVTDHLFRQFPDKEEGDLTTYRAALVNTKMLCSIAKEIDIPSVLLMSKGEAKEIYERRGEAILADAVEALIGALYLDNGYDTATSFIERYILTHVDEITVAGGKDPKSLVQEKIQEKYRITPTYKVLGEVGPSHDRLFTVGLFMDETLRAEGKGHSKQEAETEAAKIFLKEIDGVEKCFM